MDARRVKALRAMHDDWLARVTAPDSDGLQAMMELDVLTGALIGFIPELLDEIERGPRLTQPEPARFLKMDAHGGSA